MAGAACAPVWDLTGQLAGVSLQFGQAVEYADPTVANETLAQVVSLVLAAQPSVGLRVVGHADFGGADPDADRITSQKRADAVRDQLVSLGIPAQRLASTGRATEDRVEDSNEFGNANRRVVFEPFMIRAARPQ
jgi:outer membrane protein OmpA-like peptidoglycan-associated protein